MEGGYEYIIDQGWRSIIPKEKVHSINNGIDLEMFDYNCNHYTFQDSDLEDETIHNVIYTGSIRKANKSILVLPDVAAELTKRGRNDIRILLYGKGDYVETIISECKERKITKNMERTSET